MKVKVESYLEYKVEDPLELITKITKDEEVELDYNVEEILAVLLIENIVFINAPWWKEEWPKDAREGITVQVNCSDVFAWGCSDSETCYFKDLEELFILHNENKIWGSTIWSIKKRGMMPQKPVYDRIKKETKWNLDEMNLEENGSWKIYEK